MIMEEKKGELSTIVLCFKSFLTMHVEKGNILFLLFFQADVHFKNEAYFMNIMKQS